ncbi:MAG TPA: prenyltransferase [Steroidobacteraceae bacterium]|nr:prenyltransferase [Steroidobacteraceae bacterium]
MDRTTQPAGEPSVAALGGTGFGAALRRAFLATRPKFFTASVLPVLVGSAWAGAAHHAFNGLWFALAVLATVLAHAATNVYNDFGDDVNGTDPANVLRIYPYTGGSRFIQNGIMTRAATLRFAYGLAVAALATGLALAYLRGPGVVLLGVLGLALGYFYSKPGVQLSGRGAGELACAIGLGALPVAGAVWLLAGAVDLGAWLLAVIVSVWVGLILLINEVPDAAADASAGKRTLAVRLTIGGVRILYQLLTLIALVAGVVLVVRHDLPRWALVASLVLAAGGFQASRGISLDPAGREGLKKSIELTLAIHALGCIALVAAALLR